MSISRPGERLPGMQRLVSGGFPARRRGEQPLGQREDARAGSLPAHALQADARALDEEEQLIRDALGLCIARLEWAEESSASSRSIPSIGVKYRVK